MSRGINIIESMTPSNMHCTYYRCDTEAWNEIGNEGVQNHYPVRNYIYCLSIVLRSAHEPFSYKVLVPLDKEKS